MDDQKQDSSQTTSQDSVDQEETKVAGGNVNQPESPTDIAANQDENSTNQEEDQKVSQQEESTDKAVSDLNIQKTSSSADSPDTSSPDPQSDSPADKPTNASQPSETPDIAAIQTNQTVTAPASTRDGPGAKWYVVHTYSGHEAKVANTLKQRVESLKLGDKILDILIPTQDKIEIKEGKKATIKEKIFPGYLLINMMLDDNTWLAVRTTPGITGFIGTSTKPTALPEDEVKSIQRFMSMEAPKFKTTFSQGEAVKITDGPFSEFLGTVSEIDEERGKLKILVSVFGRETPVELDFLQVAKL